MKKIKVLLLILFTMLCINSLNVVKAAEELPDNGAKISSAVILETSTGTGPFDSDDTPGNDSSEDNNVVRSFDQVMWTIENTMVVNGTDATGYNGGTIYFEATLPDVFNLETASWDLDSMGWITNPSVSEDGLTLTGQYVMNKNNITVPGKQSLVFIVKIQGAKNGIEFQPVIKLWLNGNTEENVKTLIPEKTIVSAYPRYNIGLTNNSYWNQRVEVDFGNGNEIGRMYGYGITIQLYNTSASKGLKGLEFPTGDITFDLNLKMERSDLGSSTLEDITSTADVKLWNYQKNNGNTYGVIPNRTMLFSGIPHSRFDYDIPFGSQSTANMIKSGNGVYDSGKISMTQVDEDTINVTISDYKFNGHYPVCPAESSRTHTPNGYGANVGIFVSDYFQIFVPDNESTIKENSNYYLSVEDSNMKAISVSGQTITGQQRTNDDLIRRTHVRYAKGSYSQYTWLYHTNLTSILSTDWRYGDASTVIGNTFTIFASSNFNRTNEDNVYEVDKLVKFDGVAFKPTMVNNSYYALRDYQTMKFNQYFVTKKDGTNWVSQDEMNKADIEDLVIYNSLEEIPEGWLCIGEYFESKEGHCVLPYGTNERTIFVYITTKDTAKIGQTYGFTQTNKYWIEELDRTKYSQTIVNGYSSYPTPIYKSSDLNYIKTEYDENGVQVSGTHSGGHVYGNSILIVGAKQSLKQTTIDNNGVQKLNYDIGKNEYNIRYKLEPRIYQDVNPKSKITDITVTITDVLPIGLTYVPMSSNYGEPEITYNADGTTTLVWKIFGCESDVNIEPLYFEASIDENTANGVQYTNKAIISADKDKIGDTDIKNRTTTSTIQVINLSAHRLYKTTDTAVTEKNGLIHYTLSYKNNTDGTVPAFQLLDILPYNGDNRGTSFNGKYKLDRLIITQEDELGNVLSNDNLTILYTNDENVRNGVTAKDDNLGDGWTNINSGNVKQYATAFAIKGEIGPQGKMNVEIYLTPENNRGLDKYINNATAQIYDETEELLTTNVISQVVERKIEGIAWEDTNGNGIKDNNESVFKNVEITLTDEQGNQVTDVNGNIVSSVRTDENGAYVFENLPKGNYYVKVTIPNSKYQLTEKEVGANTEINSKFGIENKETDKITKLDSIDLPEITVSYVNAGLVKKPTKVIVNYKEDGTNTILHDEITIDGRIDDNYSTVNKLDVINQNHGNKYEYVRVEGNTTGTMTQDTIYVTYYYQKKPTNVKVLHVVEGTDVSDPENVVNVLYDTEEITGQVDDAYTTQNRLTEINENYKVEYEFVKSTNNTAGNMAVDTIYVIYEYKTIPAVVKVNHLEKDTNIVLNDQETLNGLVGNDYTTTDKLTAINNKFGNKYELVAQPENKNGTYTRDEQIVTYYYQKKMSAIEVNYLEVGTNIVLEEQVNATGRIDDPYTTENKLDEINQTYANKYEFVKVDGNAEGNYTLDKQVITYWYQKKESEIEVNHLEVDTENVLSEQITSTGRIDSDYTTENKLTEINAANANKYEFVRVDGKAQGQYTLEKQVITYWYQKKESTIEVNYLEVGTSKVLSEQINSTGRIDDPYTTVDKLVSINEEYANKYEFVRVDGNANGLYTLDKQVITYWYQKKESEIEVNYLEVGTNAILEAQVKSTGIVDDPYITVNKLDVINGKFANKYEFVKVDGNVEGNYTVDKQVITYWYQKKMSSIEVNYLEVGTNTVLSEQITSEGRIDDAYTTENKLIQINAANANKYEFVKVDGNTEGAYKLDKQVITYWYQKKPTSVVVKYIDKLTGEEIYNSATIEGRVDDEYETVNELDNINQEHENKYEFVEATDNTEGNMTLEQIEVIYYYQKKMSSIEVNYLEVGTEEVLSEQITTDGRIDDPYTTENKLNEINQTYANKYEFVKVDGNVEGNYTLDKQVITYWYQKKETTIEVNYLEVGTNTVLSEQITSTGRVDDPYTTENKLESINQTYANKYEFVKVDGNAEGQYTLEKQVITYWYQKKPTSVVVKYVDKSTGEEIYDSATINGRVDDTYETVNELDNINEIFENKYAFVEATDNTSGNMTVEQIEVKYYYQKKEAEVKVLHVEEGTDVSNPESVVDVLYPIETIGGKVDDAYTTQNRLEEINATHTEQYDFVRSTSNTEGKLELDIQYVIYEYKKAPSKIHIKHVELETRQELLEKETREDYVGIEYTTENRLDEINELYGDKYELIANPANKDGVYEREEQNIIYYYKKKDAKVVVKYVDIDTEEELASGEEMYGQIDSEYTTKDKVEEINEQYAPYKYVLVKTTENTEGTMTAGIIEVVYYYQKVESQVIVKFVDEKTGEEISEKEFLGGYVGDAYETEEKEIDGYIFIAEKMPENKTGEFTEETIEVIYYYSKIPEPVIEEPIVEPPATGDINIVLITGIMLISILGILKVKKSYK